MRFCRVRVTDLYLNAVYTGTSSESIRQLTPHRDLVVKGYPKTGAYTEGIQSTIHTLAEFDSEKTALRTLDGVIEWLQALQTALQT